MDLATKEFDELSFYTLGHPDPRYFIHQHAVDAFAAQTADKSTKPIRVIFSLIGLYLYLEKGYTGKQVQYAHMKLTQKKKSWTLLALPEYRGIITVSNVLKAEPGPARDAVIKDWCADVWSAYTSWHDLIASLAQRDLGVK